MSAPGAPGPDVADPQPKWPVRCPVDGRWLTGEPAACPDCGSPTEALLALNAMAARLLERAAASRSQATSVALVDDARALVPSTEAFEIATADTLESVGRPDLAAASIERALLLAPRRSDLQVRLESLRRAPIRAPRDGQRRNRIGVAVLAAVLLLAVGVAVGSLVRPGTEDGVGAVVPTPSPGSTAGRPSPSVAPSATPTPMPTRPPVSPSPMPSPSPAPPAAAIREALDDDAVLSALPVAIEVVGTTIRISGLVPDDSVAARVIAAAEEAAPGLDIDAEGLTTRAAPVYQYVQRGDTLWSIAARAYNNPRRWRDIARANPEIDPRRLVVGTRLLIPE